MIASLREHVRRGGELACVFDVDWNVRGYDLGPARFAPGSTVLPGRPAVGKVVVGSFGPITYGAGVRGGSLPAVRTTVKVEDVDGEISRLVELYDPRGSRARIRWAGIGLVEDDWQTIFDGIVEDWRGGDGILEIFVKVDDAALSSPGPKPIFSRADWGLAADPSIWGSAMALLFGIHDSFKVTGRGMVPAVNIRWDPDATSEGFWWHASIGNLHDIPRIYYDGVPQGAVTYEVLRGVYGGVYQTIISIPAGSVPVDSDGKPDKGVVVAFDCVGPDVNGGSGSDTLLNPFAIARAYLSEYVFRDNRTGVWQGTHPRINSAAWAIAEEWFDRRGSEAAVRLGGEHTRETALNVVESILKPHNVRLSWKEDGTLTLAVIDHTDPATAFWLNAGLHVADKDFRYQPGDRKEVVTGVISPYLYSSAESKFLGSYEAHDIGFVPEDDRVTVEIENRWSQGRYDKD